MKVFAITLVAAFVGYVLSDQPPFPSIEDICAASREPFVQYIDCLNEDFPDSAKNTAAAVLTCLGYDSFPDVLDAVCKAIAAGVDEDELFEAASACTTDKLDIPVISKEDDLQTEKAIRKCTPLLLPYMLIAFERAELD